MAGKKRLAHDQRRAIEVALTEDVDVGWGVVAEQIGVHRSTVQREVDANRGRLKYCADSAQTAAGRRARRSRARRLAQPSPLTDRVTRELTEKRSPAAIAADVHADGGEDGETISAEAIYQAVYAGVLGVKARDCLRRRRPKRRGRQARHESRKAGLPNILLRPDQVNLRLEPGHMEMDLIIGARNASGMLVMIERLTRYSALATLPDGYRAEAVLAAMCELLDQIPPHLRRSITFDQGSEWADWELLVAEYQLDVWFCQPHSPWQRGAVENHNGHVRSWFPRGIDLSAVTPQEADKVAVLLNGQRRKSLGGESAETTWLAAGGVVLESPQTRGDAGLIVVDRATPARGRVPGARSGAPS